MVACEYFLISLCVCVFCVDEWWCPWSWKKCIDAHTPPEPVGSPLFISVLMVVLWNISGKLVVKPSTGLAYISTPKKKNKNCAISRNIFQPRRRRRREHDNLWTADVWIELVFVTLKEKDRHIRLECNSFIYNYKPPLFLPVKKHFTQRTSITIKTTRLSVK